MGTKQMTPLVLPRKIQKRLNALLLQLTKTYSNSPVSITILLKDGLPRYQVQTESGAFTGKFWSEIQPITLKDAPVSVPSMPKDCCEVLRQLMDSTTLASKP